MAVFDEFFYDFHENVNVHDAEKYIRNVYFYKNRQLYNNKKIDIKNISTIDCVIHDLNEYNFSFISSYTDGTIFRIVRETEKQPIELNLIDSIKDHKGKIDYNIITKNIEESLNDNRLQKINIIPNIFFVLTRPKKYDDPFINDKNVLEVMIPVVLSDNDNEYNAFFKMKTGKDGNDYSIYKLFPEVSLIIDNILNFIYNNSNK